MALRQSRIFAFDHLWAAWISDRCNPRNTFRTSICLEVVVRGWQMMNVSVDQSWRIKRGMWRWEERRVFCRSTLMSPEENGTGTEQLHLFISCLVKEISGRFHSWNRSHLRDFNHVYFEILLNNLTIDITSKTHKKH